MRYEYGDRSWLQSVAHPPEPVTTQSASWAETVAAAIDLFHQSGQKFSVRKQGSIWTIGSARYRVPW